MVFFTSYVYLSHKASSLQSQFGVNLHPKRAKNRINVAKGGEANRVALTKTSEYHKLVEFSVPL
jgi:hypothetical protein